MEVFGGLGALTTSQESQDGLGLADLIHASNSSHSTVRPSVLLSCRSFQPFVVCQSVTVKECFDASTTCHVHACLFLGEPYGDPGGPGPPTTESVEVRCGLDPVKPQLCLGPWYVRVSSPRLSPFTASSVL